MMKKQGAVEPEQAFRELLTVVSALGPEQVSELYSLKREIPGGSLFNVTQPQSHSARTETQGSELCSPCAAYFPPEKVTIFRSLNVFSDWDPSPHGHSRPLFSGEGRGILVLEGEGSRETCSKELLVCGHPEEVGVVLHCSGVCSSPNFSPEFYFQVSLRLISRGCGEAMSY